MASNKHQIRLDNIVRILKEQNGSSIKQLATTLCVTEMTIRRDLKILKGLGIATIIHGAAIYNPTNTETPAKSSQKPEGSSFSMSEEAKARIGKAAAKLVEPNDILFVDAGTTTIELIRNLEQDMDITIACFAYNSFSEAKKKNISRILLGGGVFHPDTETFEGPDSLALVSNTRATKSFIAPNAIGKQLGFMCEQDYQRNLKKSFITNSAKRIILTDSSKFDKVSQFFFSDFESIDTLITDSNLSEEWQEYLKSKEINLILV